MTSKSIEDRHSANLERLQEDAGLVCDRPRKQSTPSVQSRTEEEERLELQDYEHLDLEEAVEEPETAHEPSPSDHVLIFPTPSLRRVLPDSYRQFEKLNRIHTLPEEFNREFNPLAIPEIAKTAPKVYIEKLAELVGCEEYETSLAEFWFLDTLAGLLARAQRDGLVPGSQAVLVLWWCEFMKEMEWFDAASRERMLRHFRETMLAAATFVSGKGLLPTPREIDARYQPSPDEDPAHTDKPKPTLDSFLEGHREASYGCSMRDLVTIIHYIYDLFSTEYQYQLVRMVFTSVPEYKRDDLPHRLNLPRSGYVLVKDAGKKPLAKKAAAQGKGKKPAAPEPEEYVRLMELKYKEEVELAEMEALESVKTEMRNSILPLTLATVETDFFETYAMQTSLESTADLSSSSSFRPA